MADKPPFAFPQFTVPFPFSSLPDQLAASFVPPDQQFSNASQYGRWNGVNNNAFGLFPNQFQGLFGYHPGGQMAFQPPYGNNGYLGSNQGPGSNPGGAPSNGPPPSNGGSTNSIPIPNFPAFGPGQSPFTPGLPNVPPAGYTGTSTGPTLPGVTPGNVAPAGYNGPVPSGGPTSTAPLPKLPMNPSMGGGAQQTNGLMPQPKSAVAGMMGGSFSNGLGVDPNNLPAMLGGGQATNPQALAFLNAYNQMNPSLSYSPQAVQNAQNAGRNDLAYMMLAQGGQGLRDAVGATPGDINNAFYNQGGATAQFDPATIAALLSFGATRGS